MSKRPTPPNFESKQVQRVFDAYEPQVQRKLLALRRLIFATARKEPGVGELSETLKWGQPSYLTAESKSGSTLRIGETKRGDADYAMFFHCQTTLIPSFREKYGATFAYDGNRAILFRLDQPIPRAELSACIGAALTYHLDKRRGAPRGPTWR